MAFSSSSSTGFVASFENFLQSIFHIFASFARSGLAFVQFVLALVTDILNAAYAVVRGTVGAAFGITKGAADASYKVTKGTVNTGAHVTAGVTKGAFGFMEGIIGFITGNAVAISLCIAGYYLFTSYQRQTSRNPRADTTTTAKNTIADASSRAQTDAAQTWNKANETVKSAVNAGTARADAAYNRNAKTSAAKN